MDRDQAFAFLGLSEDATHEDIQSRVDARRRQLELRLHAATTPEQRRLLERSLNELEEVRALALLDPRDPAAGLPGGAGISLKPGTLLGDRYVVKQRIGSGERGAVFRALDLTWGKDVALKALLPTALLVPGTMERLAGILRRHLGYTHGSIAAIYSLGRADHITFIASELVEGETLRQHMLRQRGGAGLTAAGIERLIAPICAALTYAADRAPHLNLKPENIIVTAEGAVKLTDFGLDEVVTVIPRGRSRAMTDQRRFRAPEQIRRGRNLTASPEAVDSRADQYAVGALVYFLATGDAPLADTADLGTRRPDLPGAMVAAVRRALSAEADARFDSIVALRSALFAEEVPRVHKFARAATIAVAILGIGAAVVWELKPSLLDRVRQGVSWMTDGRAEQQQAFALRKRADELKGRLQGAERALRSQLREARRAVQVRDTVAGAADMTELRRNLDMLESLSELTVPQVFNSPDLLNAYNLLALAADHLNGLRYRDAVAALSGAEAVMTARLADLREAERLTRARYGMEGPGDISAADLDSPEKLRAQWDVAVAERRRFALALDQGMALIPGGAFIMGDQSGGGSRAELPAHRVEVGAFKIGRTPVTRGEFMACVEVGVCRAEAIGATGHAEPTLPMTGVSWIDAQDYVGWLRTRTGEQYRLPSEAEWEYAARAGVMTAYPWGDAVDRNRANCGGCGSAWDRSGPAPVASFAANAFGLYDVIGNVWQWTADCWYRDYSSAPATGVPREEALCQQRVLRGGSWDNDAWMARLSYRANAAATLRQDLNGFRVAKSVE